MLSMMGVGYRGETVMIKGKDQNSINMVADELSYQLSQKEFVSYTNTSGTGWRPLAYMNFDHLLLNSYDINRNSITQSLSSFISGNNSGASLKIDDKEYAIVIKENLEAADSAMLKKMNEKDLEDLNNLVIRNNNGGTHKLSEIASTNLGWGESSINRVDGEKRQFLWFGFNVGQEAPKDLIETYKGEIEELLASYVLPAGVAIEDRKSVV